MGHFGAEARVCRPLTGQRTETPPQSVQSAVGPLCGQVGVSIPDADVGPAVLASEGIAFDLEDGGQLSAFGRARAPDATYRADTEVRRGEPRRAGARASGRAHGRVRPSGWNAIGGQCRRRVLGRASGDADGNMEGMGHRRLITPPLGTTLRAQSPTNAGYRRVRLRGS